ncbi:adenosylcobinamide-phosphate synthase CbiB [Peribacillus alkalitolerans]|uniref:adenosylcobinamide-phosphate synthase CbiB n=1 Tax=Peribacillus alkalitolerans TaxID=1550385 RepID=UPI0013D62BDA|nr:adenosylcobinamide-phosphate synthase CbiB [Peribacillus alkalitolerans]
MIEHCIAISIALLLDWMIGDPRWMPHPVVGMGKMINLFDKYLNEGSHRKRKGIVMVVVLILISYFVTLYLVRMFYSIHPVLGITFESIIIFTTIAQRSLRDAANEIYTPLSSGDLEQARYKLSMIVGRDTNSLPESEIVRGTVETISENTSDAITAPLFWTLIGGAPFAVVYRLVNTCDAMVGYRNAQYEQFGWASAKLDDVLNWIPSRISGWLMMVVNKPIVEISRKNAILLFLKDARNHPSPNSGWLESAAAALLGVQLGGFNRYKGIPSIRPKIGIPIKILEKHHIKVMNVIMHRTVVAFFILLWIGGICIEFTISWIKSF